MDLLYLEASSYHHRMVKQAISVTLRAPNVLWIRGQMKSRGLRSVSETLDVLIDEARGAKATAVRSVVGTIAISASDPDLAGADEDIRALFAAKLLTVAGATSARSSKPLATPKRRTRG